MVKQRAGGMLVALSLIMLLSNYGCTEKTIYKLGYLGLSNDSLTSGRIRQLLDMSVANLDVDGSRSYSIVVKARLTHHCDVGEAIEKLFDLMDKDSDILALLVFSCTEVLKVMGEYSKTLNLTVLGLGSSSAVLRNTEKYPTLQLLSEVEDTHSQARVSFITSQGWTNVATVAEDYEDSTLAAENLYQASFNSSVIVRHSMTLSYNPFDISRDIEEIKVKDVRIIFMFGSRRFIEDVLLSMASKDFFLTSRVIISNQDVSYVPSETELFYIGAASNQGIMSSSTLEIPTITGSLIKQIDAFLSIFASAGDTVTREHFTSNFIYEANLSTSIYQYHHNQRKYQLLFTYRGHHTFTLNNVTWMNGKKPLDAKRQVLQYNTVDDIILYLYITLCVAGSLLAMIFLAISCKYRNVGLIKMSSPVLNCVNIIGALSLYAAVAMMGLEHPRVSTKTYKTTCILRSFLLSIGYSLAFGPMCAKAYRVHYIISSTKHGKLSTRKRLKDRSLLLFTAGLVLIDVIFVLSWQFIDPYTINESRKLEPKKSDMNTDVYMVSFTCGSLFLHKWLGVIYAYKGAVLILGVYLAWTTRHITIPTLNDSKSIMLNIYIVLAASVIIVIASIFLKHDATLSYGIVGCLILISTTSMTSILFLPKVWNLWKLGHEKRSHSVVMQGTGLVTSATGNTRRLESHPKERLRELETQSTVFLSEIEQLEQEVDRLRAMSTKDKLSLVDFLAEDMLYILPLPQIDDEDSKHGRLYRRHTPKYKVKRQKQRELLQILKERGYSDCDVNSLDETNIDHSEGLDTPHSENGLFTSTHTSLDSCDLHVINNNNVTI